MTFDRKTAIEVTDQIDPRSLFHFEQFKSLREEIARRQLARNRIEEFSTYGVVFSYMWLTNNAWLAESDLFLFNPTVQVLVWWIPALIILVSMARQHTITRGIDRCAAFIERIEDHSSRSRHRRV